jgi:CBS domain containing-hemolysin-like protein
VTEWLLLALSLLLMGICGVFVGAEFALLAVDRVAVERAAEAGDRRAAGVLGALRSLSTQLSGVQVAITVTNLAIGFLAEPALARLLRDPLAAIGVAGEARAVVAIAVALVVSTLLTMLFGELFPKNLAIAAPLAVARTVQAPVRGFTRVMRGPIRALNAVADAVLGLFGLQAREELASARSPEELVSLVRHSADEGTLPTGTARLVVRSLAFGDKRAGEVMTPRTRMTVIAAQASVAEFLALVSATGRSRLPVAGSAGVDDVIGVLELEHAVAVPYTRRAATRVGTIMVAPVEVPESLPLDDVLRTLQTAGAQLAVVRDEYGGTAGLLTGEDLLEELVGDVDDEFDARVPPARSIADGWEVSGLLRPDEIASMTGVRLPAQGPFDTLGGLVMQRLGRIPAVGDEVRIDDMLITVTHMEGHRVDRAVLAPEHPR